MEEAESQFGSLPDLAHEGWPVLRWTRWEETIWFGCFAYMHPFKKSIQNGTKTRKEEEKRKKVYHGGRWGEEVICV